MKVIKIMFALLSIFCVFTLNACGKDETPELTEKILEKTAPEIIKEDIYFDQMANANFEFSETTEKEMNVLMKTFDYAVPYQSVHLKANISSISMDALVEYNIVYVYNNVEWKPIYCYAVNEDKWEYDAKEFVSLKQIMNDIKGFKVGNFDEGYVGNENNSSIEILNRNYEKQVNRDTVSCKLTVNTDFGTYNANIEALYYFKKGKWEIGDFTIPPMNEWQFSYSPDVQINLISENDIINKLTTKNEFLTYIVNKKYLNSDALTQNGMEASVDNVTYHYKYNAEYKKFGTISYNVDVVYKWLSFEWGEPAFVITADAQDLTPLMGKTLKNGNQSITFKSFKKADKTAKEEYGIDEETKIDESSLFIEADYSDGTTTRSLLLNLVIQLRDNDYVASVIKEITDTEDSVRFKDFSELHFFVDKARVEISGYKYR